MTNANETQNASMNRRRSIWGTLVLLLLASLCGPMGRATAFSVRSIADSRGTAVSTKTCVSSLHHLMTDTSASSRSSSTGTTTTASSTVPLTLFVGGKGGVGKTTVSSALAVQFASSSSNAKPKRVLIVSTDPAHSLGDALDVNLKSGARVRLDEYTTALQGMKSNTVTVGDLYAQEIDASAALHEFQTTLASFQVESLAQSLGVSTTLLESLGVGDLAHVLDHPPPGLDELVALSNIFSDENDNDDDLFDVIVVDTAPTGHTLRLLALPQFLDGVLTKLVQLRGKLSMLTSTLSSVFGNEKDTASRHAATMATAVTQLQTFQAKLQRLRARLQQDQSTRFVIVTVPTILGVAETKRLAVELQRQSIDVSDIVVNQCVTITSGDSSQDAKDYYNRRVSHQQKWMTQLQRAVQKVSDSPDYQRNGDSAAAPIAVTSVPFWDVELVGIPALGYVGAQSFVDQADFAHLFSGSRRNDNTPKVVICGGKGGVGKTTTSASLAIAMAASGGHKVALISTDPAHSLGDAVAMDLSGGTLYDCSLAGVPGYTGEGSLSVLEIDPTAALQQFKGLVQQLVGGGAMSGSASDANQGFRDALKDLQEVFDTLPAGTDEVVALAKIVNLVQKGGFDRIVLDTAPTGHTLRMLSTPGFLADFIERLLRISDKINANPIVKMFIATSARRDEINAAVETSKSTLLSFQFQMYDLEDLFANAQQTEFLIVTVPTELAVRESIRLLNDLTFEAPDMPIKVRNVVVNQVLRNDDGNDAVAFLSHLERTQATAMDDLERFTSSLATTSTPRIGITKVPYLDTEPRGVYGLKALAEELTKEDAKTSA